MGDGDGGGGGEGGSADRAWLPIYGRVEAMLSKSQAQSDHARLEAVNKIQRESWEAAQKLQRSVEELQAAGQKKDAEIDRLRAEVADARKADASRRRWEAAYMELLIGANQKLAELRDSDLVDSRTCAESPESTIQLKESRAKFSQGTADHEHIASDLSAELRKLKQAYETLSSKKDKQISALLAEKDLKDFLRNQLSIMEQDYSVLLKNKKVEAAKASEAAQKLQQNVDELQVSVRKKDNEIGRLQAEAVDFKKKLQKMYSLAKEKDDEIQRLKDGDPETIQKCVKDINQTHKKSTADGPAGKSKNNCPRQMIEEDGQAETSQKRKRACASSLSNDEEQSGSYDDDDDDDDDEQNGNFHDDEGDEQSGSYDDGDDDNNNEQSGNFDDDDDSDDQSGSDDETTNNQVQNPRGKPKRKRDAWNAQVANSESNSESNGAVERRWTSKAPAPLRSRKLVTTSCRRAMVPTGNWAQYVNDVKDSLGQQPDKHEEFIQFLHNFEAQTIGAVARTMKVLLDGHPELIRRFNAFLPNSCQIELKEGEQHRKEKKPTAQLAPSPSRIRLCGGGSPATDPASSPDAAPPPPSAPPPPRNPNPSPLPSPLPFLPAAAPAHATLPPLRRRPLRCHRRPLGPHPFSHAAAPLLRLLPLPPQRLELPPQRPPPFRRALLGSHPLRRRRRRPEGRRRRVPGGGEGAPDRARGGLPVGEPGRRAAVRAPVGRRRRAQVEAAGRVAGRVLPRGGRRRRLPPRRAARQVHPVQNSKELQADGIKGTYRVDVDIPADDWVNITKFYDVLIFNTGHWWGPDKFPKETPLVFYRGGKPIEPPLGIFDGLKVVLKSMASYIEMEVPSKTLKLWRTQSPRHFYGGEWDHNGSCVSDRLLEEHELDSWFDPRFGGVNKEARLVNSAIQEALVATDIQLLNLTYMSEFRADAHPAIWLGKKDAVAVWGQDCMHWCLPGVPDTWVDILAAQILHYFKQGKG